jgi:hypothetical protein
VVFCVVNVSFFVAVTCFANNILFLDCSLCRFFPLVANVKERYHANKLPDERIERLNSIAFDWGYQRGPNKKQDHHRNSY